VADPDAEEALAEALDGPLGDELGALWDALDDLVLAEGADGLVALLSSAPVGGPLGALPVFSLDEPDERAAFAWDLDDLAEVYSGNAALTPLGGAMALVSASLRGGERQRCAALLTFTSVRELHEVDQLDRFSPAGEAAHGDADAAADDGLADAVWRYGADGWGLRGLELLVTVGVAPGGRPALLVLTHDPGGPPGFDPLFGACRDEAIRIAAVLVDELG
jgi:hypothetical protein